MNIPFTQHTLENGLRVIIHEDRRLPMVAVGVLPFASPALLNSWSIQASPVTSSA